MESQQYDPNNPQQYNPHQQPIQYPTEHQYPYPQQPNIPTTAPKPPIKLSFLDEIMLLDKKALLILATVIIVIIVAIGSYLYYTDHNTPPEIKIANLDTLESTPIQTGTSITFDASSSTDNHEIKSYKWDFGDGTTKDGKIVNYKYAKKGEYTAKLTIIDNDGMSITKTFSIKILNSPPVANINVDKTTTRTYTDISFDASTSSDIDGDITSYSWDFGDSDTASGMTTSHNYTIKGAYAVKLTIVDNDMGASYTTVNLTIENTPPTVDFTASKTTFQTKETITLDASASSDIDGSIASYLWDFGDGNTSSGVTTSHKYAKKGVSTITVTVTDNDGSVTTKSVNVTVQNTPPVANAGSSRPVYVDSAFPFDGSASTDSDGAIVKYEWDFGDGLGADYRVSGTRKYTSAGAYTVKLTVTDNDGGQHTATITITAGYDIKITSTSGSWRTGVWNPYYVNANIKITNYGDAKSANTIKVTVEVYSGSTQLIQQTKTVTSVVSKDVSYTVTFTEIPCPSGSSAPTKINVILTYNNGQRDVQYDAKETPIYQQS
ncbi:MAG: PKD domain-containing protein [Thermoplasmata archaeon]